MTKPRTRFLLLEFARAVGSALAIFFLISANTSAQGTLVFNNRLLRHPDTGLFYDAPVTLPDGSRAAGDRFTAGLFIVEAGGLLRPVAESVFRTGSAAGFFIPQTITLIGIPAGSSATFRIRVWETAAVSYESAALAGLLHGEFHHFSGDPFLVIPQLGSNLPGPIETPNLSGIQPLTLIPEPTSTAFLILGFILLTLCNRKKVCPCIRS